MAIKFYNHQENLVKTSVRTISLQIFTIVSQIDGDNKELLWLKESF